MIGAFWICVFMVVVGIILYIGELRWRHRNRGSEESSREANLSGGGTDSETKTGKSSRGKGAVETRGMSAGVDVDAANTNAHRSEGDCCGLHLVCEKDSLSPMSDEILYYDDEELDRFIGRSADSYTSEEEEEFREVLMTLRPEDIAGWARSVTQRQLELPPDVRDELLMLVNDQRGRGRV